VRIAARGFTLIEVMIVVVVLGILAMVAYPSYQESVRKSRRSEAMTALMAVQQAQERWRGNNANYTTDLDDLGLSSTTPSGYYAISIAAAPASAPLATAYVATAVGKDGTSQAADTQCRKLGVQMNGGNLSYAGCGSCDSLTYTPTNECWAR
jgi:type IV pilus assembly protein PilE